jgi:two-component system, NtrC family, sensor kinase
MKPMFIFPLSIRFRTALLVYVMLPMVFTVGVFAYFALNSIENQVEKQMQKDLELVARAVQLPLSYALEKDRMGSLQQSLESVFAIGRVYSAYVYDHNGQRILNLGHEEPESQSKRLSELAADGRKLGEYEQIAGRQVYSYFLPLTDTGGQINGLLQLTRKQSEFIENFHILRRNAALVLSLLLVLLSGVVLYGHHQAIGGHLGRLTASMTKVAAGDRKHRFAHSGPREIVALGKTFNNMLNSIDDAQKTILEQRRKQDELEKQLRQNEKLAALGRFAAGAAHELGTPLSTIGGRAQRVLRTTDLPGDVTRVLTTIRSETARMESIIKQLLDFCRPVTPRKSNIDVADLTQSALSVIQQEAQKNQTETKYVPSNDTATIQVDVMRVQQALGNLLRNAVQSTPGGVVRVSWRRDSEGVLFCVEDDGPGICKKDKSRVFEPFFTTKPVGKGTGLGLSVVHAVAEEHNGYVRVMESEMGGACFQLFVQGYQKK